MSDFVAFPEPGMRVEAPARPEWGVGQVQSSIAGKVTVNIPDAGKVVIDTARVMLLPVLDP